MDYIHPEVDDDIISRHLEAYLLWLFWWIIFTATHDNSVSKTLIAYAMEIDDVRLGEVPSVVSWTSTVLAMTYKCLCEAWIKVDLGIIFFGCPLLLQLWPYEQYATGRPILVHTPYDLAQEGRTDLPWDHCGANDG